MEITTRILQGFLADGQINPAAIEAALTEWHQHRVVAFPTETVYGLGAPIFDEAAIKSIYQTKGRPADNPLIAHVSSWQMVEQIVSELPEAARRLAKSWWPGPLTMVLPARESVPAVARAGLPTIGVRWPAHGVALELIGKLDQPVVAPSANLSGLPSPTTAAAVAEDLDGRVGLIIDGGNCEVGVESTIIDLSGERPVILRPGVITAEELSETLGQQVSVADSDAPLKAPGMKYRHYAPKARVMVQDIDALNLDVSLSGVLLSRQQLQVPANWQWLPLQLSTLFEGFRQADRLDKSLVIVALTVDDRRNQALMNRVMKAIGSFDQHFS
jgi:L-threonylcarbamoyladenylate synthase